MSVMRMEGTRLQFTVNRTEKRGNIGPHRRVGRKGVIKVLYFYGRVSQAQSLWIATRMKVAVDAKQMKKNQMRTKRTRKQI